MMWSVSKKTHSNAYTSTQNNGLITLYTPGFPKIFITSIGFTNLIVETPGLEISIENWAVKTWETIGSIVIKTKWLLL